MATTLAKTTSTQEKLLRARVASAKLAQLSTGQKNALLLALADAVEAHEKDILAANQGDIAHSGLDGAMRDRLLLTSDRIKDMARGVRDVVALPDPIGETLAEWTKENGLRIRKVRVPLGVVGIIYESRPNVTVDTAVLALKTGNAVVLRGGKEAARSNQCLVEIMAAVPEVPEGAIELLDSGTRQTVHDLIKARGLVDVIIPRGGAGLITFVTENSTVPVIETGAGNCHIFVDASADFDMADRIVINAKTQRPSVCNAAEKMLVHERVAAEYIPRIAKKLIDAGVELHAPTGSNTQFDVELEVPANTHLDIHQKVGDLTIDSVEGDKDLNLGVGDIRVSIGRSGYRLVNASTGIGDVDSGYGETRGWLGQTLKYHGEGKFELRAHVGVGDIKLEGQ